jgi:Cu2+-exporting ATPase
MNGIALAPSDAHDAASHVRIAIDRQLAASVRLQDQVNESARLAIGGLRELGVTQVWLATGDREPVARSVADQLGIHHVAARLMPEEKAELVRRLRRDGRTVGLVGDGINDAAAMAEANVGIAVSRGADMAREIADVVLLTEDLQAVVEAVRLAKSAMSIVRQNIALVAIPNTAGLGIAVLGRLHPIGATLLNNGSTLIAETNALRPLLLAGKAQPGPHGNGNGAAD